MLGQKPVARTMTSDSTSQVVVFAPQSNDFESALFPWASGIEGILCSDESFVDHLRSEATRAVMFYGEPPKIGNVDLLSDEVLSLLTRSFFTSRARPQKRCDLQLVSNGNSYHRRLRLTIWRGGRHHAKTVLLKEL
jgi:hypothetical protein